MSAGLLSPGTKLPSERELAANFGVARSSLRPALKVFEIMGVITQKVGDGSYLNNDASSVLSVPMGFLFLLDDTSLQELTELRLMMEPALGAKSRRERQRRAHSLTPAFRPRSRTQQARSRPPRRFGFTLSPHHLSWLQTIVLRDASFRLSTAQCSI